jgi:hypothetical protein
LRFLLPALALVTLSDRRRFMILVRLAFQAKFGKTNEVVAAFKQGQEMLRPIVGPNVHAYGSFSASLNQRREVFDDLIRSHAMQSIGLLPHCVVGHEYFYQQAALSKLRGVIDLSFKARPVLARFEPSARPTESN